MKIVGMIQKKGTYEGYDYNKINIHCTYQDSYGKAAGVLTCIHKIKVQDIESIFGKKYTEKELEALVGKEIEVYYDQWRNVEKIIVL